LRRLKGSNIHRLFISGNRIGDEGATALAHALAFGALPQLQRFHAQNNTVGDVGFGNIAVQIGEGRLEHLTLLDLSRNAISNESMHMLAGALVGKDHQVLQHLQTLYLTSNKIGCAGVTSFAKAVASNNRILPQLKILWFNRNQIKDVGVASFHAAISAGALGLLKELMFQGNEANVLLTKAVSETLDARGGEMINEEHRVLEENQYDSMRGL
jgi:Ran GTPase-activating protein (RanGAP) involved in mRNA processing and transport